MSELKTITALLTRSGGNRLTGGTAAAGGISMGLNSLSPRRHSHATGTITGSEFWASSVNAGQLNEAYLEACNCNNYPCDSRAELRSTPLTSPAPPYSDDETGNVINTGLEVGSPLSLSSSYNRNQSRGRVSRLCASGSRNTTANEIRVASAEIASSDLFTNNNNTTAERVASPTDLLPGPVAPRPALLNTSI